MGACASWGLLGVRETHSRTAAGPWVFPAHHGPGKGQPGAHPGRPQTPRSCAWQVLHSVEQRHALCTMPPMSVEKEAAGLAREFIPRLLILFRHNHNSYDNTETIAGAAAHGGLFPGLLVLWDPLPWPHWSQDWHWPTVAHSIWAGCPMGSERLVHRPGVHLPWLDAAAPQVPVPGKTQSLGTSRSPASHSCAR